MPGIDWFSGSELQAIAAGVAPEDYPGAEEANRLARERPPGIVDDDQDTLESAAEPTPIALVEDSNHNVSETYRADENDSDMMKVDPVRG